MTPEVVVKLERAAAETATLKEVAAEAEKDKEKAKLEVAEVRSGKLLQYGITGGVAVGAHIPLGRVEKEQAVLRTAAFATVPYVLFVPGYWGGKDARNAYCASEWSGTDFSDASAAATSKALKRAEIRYTATVDTMRAHDLLDTKAAEAANVLCGAEAELNVCEEFDIYASEVRSIHAIENLATKNQDQRQFKDARRAEMLRTIALHDWNPTLGTNCWGRRFGLWIGIPIDYTARVQFEKDAGRLSRDVDAMVSVGGAFLPNAYVSGLVGATYGLARKVADDDDSKESVWSLNLAVGGNLDIATLLVQ